MNLKSTINIVVNLLLMLDPNQKSSLSTYQLMVKIRFVGKTACGSAYTIVNNLAIT